MEVLVCGASIAGPVLAYWLHRFGFTVTVVEKAPALRKAGGHAVDLFAPAMDIVERMGVLEPVLQRHTGTQRLVVRRVHTTRPVTIDLTAVMTAVSRRHVEIMRDDLSEIFYDATRDEVDYRFDDTVTAVGTDGRVSFAHAPTRRFDLVVGADGLHSTVRHVVFGPESAVTSWLGGYLAVASPPPNYLRLRDAAVGQMIGVLGVDRFAGVYSARHLTDARILFMFRPAAELHYDHHDQAAQKLLLRQAFAGLGEDVERMLEETDRADTFYFDAITQLQLPTWSRGRVTLVGDAGYCPGPAVGGSTSLAVVGAYTLAGELAAARGDHTLAYPAYERALADYVRRSRSFARRMAAQLLPRSRLHAWAMTTGVKIVTSLPTPLLRAATSRTQRLGLHDTVTVRHYDDRYRPHS